MAWCVEVIKKVGVGMVLGLFGGFIIRLSMLAKAASQEITLAVSLALWLRDAKWTNKESKKKL